MRSIFFLPSVIDRPVKTYVDIMVRLQDTLPEFSQQQIHDEVLTMIAAVSTIEDDILDRTSLQRAHPFSFCLLREASQPLWSVLSLCSCWQCIKMRRYTFISIALLRNRVHNHSSRARNRSRAYRKRCTKKSSERSDTALRKSTYKWRT